MYYIQGADQKQYGPVSADQLRQWISENRLNRSSPCRSETDTTWRTVGDYPEFADLLTPAVPSAAQTPYVHTPSVVDGTDAFRRLAVPAIAIIVMSVLGLIINLSTPIWYKAYLEALANIATMPPDARNSLQEAASAGMTVSTVVQLVVGVAFNILTLVGALRMKAGRSYGLAMTSAILILLPCSGCCCLIGLPFGIWALVVMNQPEVRGSFR